MSQSIGLAVLKDVLVFLDRPKSWAKGVYKRPSGDGPAACCMDGAIKRIAKNYGGKDAEVSAQILLCESAGWRVQPGSIHEWNDKPHRTHEQVIKLLTWVVSTTPSSSTIVRSNVRTRVPRRKEQVISFMSAVLHPNRPSAHVDAH